MKATIRDLFRNERSRRCESLYIYVHMCLYAYIYIDLRSFALNRTKGWSLEEKQNRTCIKNFPNENKWKKKKKKEEEEEEKENRKNPINVLSILVRYSSYIPARHENFTMNQVIRLISR